ncbi:ATP-binding cassette domain-containing protein [Lignipirellula cremea]|uniref:Glycine betaine/carnitine/choline transport ATP-binding protein OpuCA n=1 Tax=Lignipirellula cremea TaxID=2528010 RepID=A0A518DPW3_9BACT|nr:ATP-binding cassette domain-containing protein [Lignipirellula cremea]QDU93875.1 Glycine betaine/carnitine/choline transport ATP-binding protein OpuCA [Lignipirellula cremea]
MLELRGVSKAFGELQALKPIDLKLKPGKTTALIGPSGCGKSTLLRVMVGLIAPDQGEVLFDGEPVTDNWQQVRRRMGYVIQDGGLFPHLTIRGNVSLMARHLRWPAEKIEARLQELARLTQLDPVSLDRFPMQVSGGQRQRVSMIRALFLDPDMVLLDEPMGALDPLIRSELQNDLKTIFQQMKKTVVMVTHDISEAGFLAEDILLLKAGQVMQRGSLEELVKQPADPFVSTFINAQRSPLEALH